MARKLNIVIVTQGVSRVVDPLMCSQHNVVGILESMPRSFSGVPSDSFIIKILKKIYYALPISAESLKEYCRRKNIPYCYIWSKNQTLAEEWIRKVNPDLVVVFGMSQLLKNDILKIPKLGVINLHPSFLPSYRGPNPDFWQYYDEETFPGVTVHYLDAGEDTGDIIYQEKLHIPLGTKSPERLNKLIGGLGVQLLFKAIDAIAQGHASRITQPKQSPTVRARNLTPEEHSIIIDWKNWPIERIWHILRGTESWLNAVPMPKGVFAGQRWVIKEYEKTEAAVGHAGTLGRYKKCKCIFTSDGVIYVGIDFQIRKTLIKLLRK